MQIARRLLFFTLVLCGASIFWLAKHPPMVDVPQHAGQIALLVDMFRGNAPWQDVVRLNLATPYLIGYGLALPLSLVMPAAFSIKILLSLAYFAFVGMGMVLRRHFGADERLDWLFLFGFFGMAGYWGFFTFLTASPIVFLLIYVSDLHAGKPTLGTACRVCLVGLLLIVSHGLAFCMGWAIGASLIFAYHKKASSIMHAAIPFLLLLIPLAFYTVASQRLKLEITGSTSSGKIIWDHKLHRIINIFTYTVGNTREVWVYVVAAITLAAPWLMGLRIAAAQPRRWIPFAAVMLVLLVIPETALDTAALYTRFPVFLLPSYVWMFSRPDKSAVSPAGLSHAWLAEGALAGACMFVLGLHAWQTIQFDREEADFRAVIAPMEPGQRALSMVFDTSSIATNHPGTYVHIPVWYQAEKHGFVDFNFAWFPPQLVRFRQGHVPIAIAGFEWNPEKFDWLTYGGNTYRYFIVRRGPTMPADLFKGAPCKPTQLSAAGTWIVYEQKPCR